VSFSLAHIRVDSTHTQEAIFHTARPRALETPKGGESILSITDLVQYLRARFDLEEGQTMAEYGVVLAVITVAAIVALGVLSGAITGAIQAVANRL
jgi:Flp pilus assembly pilin Flp